MKNYHKIGNRYVEIDSYQRKSIMHSKMLGAVTFVLMAAIAATCISAAFGIDITQLHQEIHHE
jgi:hypothetical protein